MSDHRFRTIPGGLSPTPPGADAGDRSGCYEARFFAPGRPATKGSFRPFATRLGLRARNDNPRTGTWQTVVATCARVARVRLIPSAPVSLELDFRLARPQSHRRRDGSLRVAYLYVATRGRNDLDKLARACFDALTGIAWVDDGQVAECRLRKMYAERDADVGVHVTIREVADAG